MPVVSETRDRPWWAYSKEERKQRIEDAIDASLARPEELTDRQKLVLRDAISHAYHGLFDMAAQDLYDLGLPESAWGDSARVDPGMVEGVTRETLRRALAALRASPPQMHPVFR
jgi:hypothetical protein